VENYRRQPRASTDTDQSHTLIQHAENEVLISNSGKINRYVTVGLELLEVSALQHQVDLGTILILTRQPL
jgi:hypothetical protein